MNDNKKIIRIFFVYNTIIITFFIQNFINFFIRGNLININILGTYLIAESRMPGFMRCGASDVVHASWRQAPAMGAFLPESLNLDLNMFPKYYFAKMRNSDFKI